MTIAVYTSVVEGVLLGATLAAWWFEHRFRREFQAIVKEQSELLQRQVALLRRREDLYRELAARLEERNGDTR